MGAMQIVNSVTRSLSKILPGYFPETSLLHNHNADYGRPDFVTFDQLWYVYNRNGFAKAVVNKTVSKVWQDNPKLIEDDDPDKETPNEKAVAEKFQKLRFWQKLMEADRRSYVGGYAGVIFRFADSQGMDAPVTTVPGGIDGLVEIIPAWKGELTVSQWDEDETSLKYGQPLLFQYQESPLDKENNGKLRSHIVHRDRCYIWSKDGTVHAESLLLAGYNDLIDLEKINGAGGEGYWKNAKSAPVIQVDNEARLDDKKTAEEIRDDYNKRVEEWQKGFNKLLMIQGMEAKTLGVTLPQPQEFLMGSLQSLAASASIPLKILIGSQSGERASTEDAQEWAYTGMSYRNNEKIPAIMDIVDMLKAYKILSNADWSIDWSDLTETSMEEKTDRSVKMVGINKTHYDAGGMDPIFSEAEVRETMGYPVIKNEDEPDDEGDDLELKPDQPPEPDNQEEETQ